MSAAIQRVDAAGGGLERMAERRRTGREQVRQVAIMTAVGAVAGIIVWVGLSGPIARAPAGLGADRDGRESGAGEPACVGGLLESDGPDGQRAALHGHGQG